MPEDKPINNDIDKSNSNTRSSINMKNVHTKYHDADDDGY